MKAQIDADILPYEFGGMVHLEDPDEPLPFEIVRSMVDDRIKQIIEATSATEYALYLTDSASNFRMRVGTILPYKGHRKTEKPLHWAAIRQHLIDQWDAEVQYGIEADDRLGIEQCKAAAETTVICSRDKDLHMIPGWHYTWPAGKQKERLWFQDETSAIRCFYRQLLTGDTTDNILGLYGVGVSSQLVKRLEDVDEEWVMFETVYDAYVSRFGRYAGQFMCENAALLWMLREELEPAYLPEFEVEERFNNLMYDCANRSNTDE
jgi:hypothetical protein